MLSKNIIYKIAFGVLFCGVVSAQNVFTVCASGCVYSSLNAALLAAPENTIIELAAGESFAGHFQIAAQRGLTIRSSRWRELPSEGFRIDPVKHAPLLATIRANSSESALTIGSTENAIALNGVNIDSDLITFDFSPLNSTPNNGVAVVCRARTEYLAALPQPLVYGRKYWVRDWNQAMRTGRLAASLDGPGINLTTIGSANASNYYDRPACTLWEQPRDITIQGIRFDTTTGTITRNLVEVGQNTETNPVEMGPANINFEHSVITGSQTDEGPLFCLAIFGGYQMSVTDSWIGHCKQTAGNESKGIAIQNVVGAVIQNNYISAASINFLTGGSDAASGKVSQDLIVTGNFLEKPGYMMYKEGAGAPTGGCYYGGGAVPTIGGPTLRRIRAPMERATPASRMGRGRSIPTRTIGAAII